MISWYLDIGDINYLRFFETKFLAIVYDDALKSDLEFSSKPTLSSQHVDEIDWKNKTSLSEYDNEEYNVISKRKAKKKRFSKKEKFNILSIDKDLFSYDIFSFNDLKLDKDNDEDKIVLYQDNLAKVEKERVLEHKRRSSRESINMKNTTYHSRQILSIPRLRRIQDHCLTLKNTTYPHQQIRRI
ncbi:hypothetical protein Tco_0238181 [Tanacetum coccineum]